MADRKLYHLVNGEFVLNGMPSVHVPTYEEVKGHLEILRNVGFFDDAEIAEPVTFTGESNGRRTTEKQASVYDAMMAEIYAEHDGNKAKVRNRRSERRNHMAENWEAEKEHRKDLHWNHLEKKARRDAGCKFGNHWASNAERKICHAEIVARKDWEIEQGNMEVARLDAEIMAEYAEWEARREFEDMCRKLNEWLKYA